jgi:hypothetical protein
MKNLGCSVVSATALSLIVAAVAMAGSASARADEVRWQTVIGLIQPGNAVGSGTGQVMGGIQPWSALGGQVKLNLETGQLEFNVRGLVRAGGNGIGIPELVFPNIPLTHVVGTLVCDTDGSAGNGNSTVVSTDPVPISATGDARFSGVVQLPAVCVTEPDIAFLIGTSDPQIDVSTWIANGAVRRRSSGDHDN